MRNYDFKTSSETLLQPWVHYIPVKADLSDLVERIHWARDNDDKAKKEQTPF